ncbi:MAG TPA: hypothetical protein PLK55_01255 [archaeon]|jgi:hypothetical protein|nr:hypothetical protein [archaeon]
MIQDPRIIDNIKKLKELGMSNDDIKDNLIKMGLSSDDCDELIAASNEDENKNRKLQEKEQKKEKIKKEEIFSEPKKNEPAEIPETLFQEDNKIDALKEEVSFTIKDDFSEIPDLTSGLDVDQLNNSDTDINFNAPDLSREEEKIKFEKPKNKDFDIIKSIDLDKINAAKLIDTTPSETLKELDANSNIWGSGLATTLNARLNEIDEKQENFEKLLKKKMEDEVKKFKQIQETSKQLLAQKIDEELASRTANINSQLTKQLAQIKVELIKINKKSDQMTTGKQEVEDLIKRLKEIQTQVLENNNKSQENINRMVLSTSVKLNTKIKEINDILALQSKITQGLIKNTQTAITNEIKKFNQFKEELENKINPQQMYDKLNQLETFKQQLASRYETRFENVKREFLIKAKDAFKEEIETQLKELKNIKETIVAKTDPKLISDKLEELESFQNHLISAIDEKISQSLKIYQSAMTQDISSKAKTIDEEVVKVENAIVKLGDAEDKIKELDQFKDQFIAIIDKNIERMNATYSKFEQKLKEIEDKQKLMI